MCATFSPGQKQRMVRLRRDRLLLGEFLIISGHEHETMKHRIVHFVQKYLLNPPIKLLFAMGVVLPGYALLETTGRKTGKPRRTPVGDGLVGKQFWIVTEHGQKAGYVRNIAGNPRVRLKLRDGLARARGGTPGRPMCFRTMMHESANAGLRTWCRPARAMPPQYASSALNCSRFGLTWIADHLPESVASCRWSVVGEGQKTHTSKTDLCGARGRLRQEAVRHPLGE